MISRLMLNLRNLRLPSRSHGEVSMPVGRNNTNQVFFTLFNTIYTLHTTDENGRSTPGGAGDPEIELTSECVVLRLKSITEWLPTLILARSIVYDHNNFH
jgi:hypothetical protein